jgi:hypothetical protein
LRLVDVEKWHLESEEVDLGKSDPTANLRTNGATADEVAFLRQGRRVELNAFASGDFVTWIEGKLDEQGVKKVIPDRKTLEAAYRRAAHRALLLDRFDTLQEEISEEVSKLPVPKDLADRINKHIEGKKAQPWDEALAEIAAELLDVDHVEDDEDDEEDGGEELDQVGDPSEFPNE